MPLWSLVLLYYFLSIYTLAVNLLCFTKFVYLDFILPIKTLQHQAALIHIHTRNTTQPLTYQYTHTRTHTQWPDEQSTSTPSTTPPPAAMPATPAPSSPSSRASCARPRRGSRAAGPASRRPRLRSRPSKIQSSI
ncbi:hypothetical protein V8C26DRAFT_383800 [Trichoderma gracile]